MRFCAVLLVFVSLFIYGALLRAEDSSKKPPVSLVVSKNGDETLVIDPHLYIVQGRRAFFSRSIILIRGKSILTIPFKSLAGIKYTGQKDKASLIFYDGSVLEGKIRTRSSEEYLVALALIGGQKVPFKLNILKMVSIVQVDPPIPGKAEKAVEDKDIKTELDK
jgi:hypothetical protein